MDVGTLVVIVTLAVVFQIAPVEFNLLTLKSIVSFANAPFPSTVDVSFWRIVTKLPLSMASLVAF